MKTSNYPPHAVMAHDKPIQPAIRLIIWLALLSPVLGLVSCSNTGADSSFKAYEAQIVSNPSPNAVVGLWQSVNVSRVGGEKLIDDRKTFLFRSNGTGLLKSRIRAAGKDFDNPPVAFTWRYHNDGTWSTTADNPAARYRFAGNALLYYLDTNGLKIRVVFLRAN